ncbi:MAG: uracil-DNA glycosylase [Advenella sp.]
MSASNNFNGSLPDQLMRCHPQWQALFNQPSLKPVLENINHFLSERLQAGATIYPAAPLKIFEQLGPEDTRVVILGQDPYHGPGQAQGLAFSVPDQIRTPPSLRNIFKELAREYNNIKIEGNDLNAWVSQGVMLLNTVLTVENAQPASHARLGWHSITDAVISHLANQAHCVFLLWGAHAQSKIPLIMAGQGKHLILKSNHPSPLSASRPPEPFLGNGHFKACNEWLSANALPPVNWSLTHNDTKQKQQLDLNI